MGITVRDFLGYSFNHGDYITIINDGELNGELYPIIWEGKYETIGNPIPNEIAKSNVVKWGIENNSIVIYIKL